MNFLALITGASWVRIAGAVGLAILLASTHYKAYHAGGVTARAEHAEYVKDLSVASAKASAAARNAEKTINLSVGRLRDELAKEKSGRAADNLAAAGRLRDLQSALGNSTSPDSATACGTDADPRDCIIAQCTAALARMDQAIRELSDQTKALQNYTDSVRVTP